MRKLIQKIKMIITEPFGGQFFTAVPFILALILALAITWLFWQLLDAVPALTN